MTVRWRWIAAVALGAAIGLGFSVAAGELGEPPWSVDKADVVLPTSVWWTFPR